MKKLIYVLPALAALTACGGGGGGTDAVVGNTAPPAVTTAPMTDAFFTSVSGIVGVSSDTTEPTALDASAPSASDNSEPSPLS